MAVTQAKRAAQSAAGLPGLILGFFAGPIAWLIDLEASYATLPWVCAHGRRDVLFLIPVACLALIAAGSWVCWSGWRQRQADFDGGRRKNWMSFIAMLGLMMHATFGLLIVTTFAGRYFLSPCE